MAVVISVAVVVLHAATMGHEEEEEAAAMSRHEAVAVAPRHKRLHKKRQGRQPFQGPRLKHTTKHDILTPSRRATNAFSLPYYSPTDITYHHEYLAASSSCTRAQHTCLKSLLVALSLFISRLGKIHRSHGAVFA